MHYDFSAHSANLFAKLMISSDFSFILHVFLAECVCFLTVIGKLTFLLTTILFQLKEKQVDFSVVSLGLSLDVLIYIIRYSKLESTD